MAGMSEKTEVAHKAADSYASWAAVRETARFLRDEKAQDVQVLQVAERSSIADFFIIATAQSLGQLRGLVRNIDEPLAKHGVRARGGKRSINEDDNWVLLDCDDFVVHLMLQDAREYYDLEKFWFDSPRLADQV